MAYSEKVRPFKKERLSERELQKLQDNVDEKMRQLDRLLKEAEERLTAGGL